VLGGSGWIVIQAGRHKLQASRPHPLFRIGDADQAHPMAALPQDMAVVDQSMGRKIEIFRLLWERSGWAARRNHLQ
jgi:hypothetical protein